jgi:peptidoglycan hydrolase-like protein with peptidoglycan-binding domain
LQRLLKSLTFNGKDGRVLTIDGDFGTNTEYALRGYQKANNLEVDGICGKNSWNSILK